MILYAQGGNDMGKVLFFILLLLLVVILWSLPLYLCVNLVVWLFNSALRITLFQSFGLCLLATVIKSLLFKRRDD